MITIKHIGSPTTIIPGWPAAGTLEGLFDALSRWTLDPRLDMRDEDEQHAPPFRARAWGYCEKRWSVAKGRYQFHATKPIYPDSPDAVAYCGNFLGHSFGFALDTDEPELIARLDAAIAANMQRPEYLDAVRHFEEKMRPQARRPEQSERG